MEICINNDSILGTIDWKKPVSLLLGEKKDIEAAHTVTSVSL